MTPNSLKIGLAVSVALNLFAIAAGVTAVVNHSRIEARVEADRRTPRASPIRALIASMDPEIGERVHAELRASALASRSDFEEARSARRSAVALAGGETFDAAEVRAMLERSRTAELRGRARLEETAVSVLATLDVDDRKALAPILARRGGRNGRGGAERGPHADRNEAPPPH
ncbi:periplasmic heavy metal sensor [uncultured Brevundimonas sp.]|uniref:periplasmic heavy metal sensor n=1 Tax=uncultured Brevundimonas sp. TaxID=213418 RepID=UPI0030EBC04D|tara:strand:+ start:843 stop:1361 length:519 start_codon:yes stop_codon:yes gene_type:complete